MNAEHILYASRPGERGDEEDEQVIYSKDPQEAEGAEDLPHLLDLVSREGQISSFRDFENEPVEEKKVSTDRARPSTLTLAFLGSESNWYLTTDGEFSTNSP